MSEALRATGEKGRGLKALFITVDPERDKPEALKSYLSSFDDRIVGLTGTLEAIEATVRAYRGFARKVPTKDGDYTMEHTALVYLMDKSGRFIGSSTSTGRRKRPRRSCCGMCEDRWGERRHQSRPPSAGTPPAPVREVRANPCSVLFQRKGSAHELDHRPARRRC